MFYRIKFHHVLFCVEGVITVVFTVVYRADSCLLAGLCLVKGGQSEQLSQFAEERILNKSETKKERKTKRKKNAFLTLKI